MSCVSVRCLAVAGGLDMAVEAVFGGTVVWHSEIDKAASKVLAHRYPGVPNLRRHQRRRLG